VNFSSHKRRRAPSVIIVSLIDVLLVVMIFLMVTTTFKAEPIPQLKLALPSAQKAKPGASETPPFIVTVRTNFPFVFVGTQPVTLAQLQNALSSAAQLNPQINVAIRADKNAPFGEVIKVIDAAKLASVGSISAITERSP